MTVVDASVVVKWYIPEQDHEPARDLRDDYLDGSHDLQAPELLPFEVVNALQYSSQYDGDRLVEAAETLPKYGIEFVPFGRCGAVAAVADELDVTVYDASYVALAAEAEDVCYTADEALVKDVTGSDYGDHVALIGEY